MVSNPWCLFADEPTSGLTSKEARITMEALARVAASGRPVLCTIHQPSAYIFTLFHRLMLLKRGGEVVFFGKLGKNCENLINYFQGVPAVTPIKEDMNPATWVLEVIGSGIGHHDEGNGVNFAEVYRLSDLCEQNLKELEELASFPPPSVIVQSEKHDVENSEHQNRRGYCFQLQLLMKRNLVEYWRSPNYSLLRWTLVLFFAIIDGTTFLRQQMKNVAGVQSRVGIIFQLAILTSNYNNSTIIPFIFQRRALFYREKASGMYQSFIYALSFQFIEEPFIFVEVFLSVTVFYFLVGLAPYPAAFFYYLFLLYFLVLFFGNLGSMYASLLGNQSSASLVSVLTTQFLLIFSGVAIPGNQLASWLLGFYYLTPVRWALEGAISNQFDLYTEVICNPTGNAYTWRNGSTPSPNCVKPTIFYLSDVEVNACCDNPNSFPISAKAYVLYGWTYPTGLHVPPWLGGTNGYNPEWQGYDYLYVIMAMLIVRILMVLFTQYINHQKR